MAFFQCLRVYNKKVTTIMMIKLKRLTNHHTLWGMGLFHNNLWVDIKFYSTSFTSKGCENWPEILGKRGPLLPAHHIAHGYIKEGKPIRAVDVNRVLSFADIKITQSRLDEILSTPVLTLLNLDCNTIKSDYFLQNIGTVRSKIQVPGVYIWTHLATGHKYVGSSSALARRLIGYFNGTHKSTGKLIPLIKSEGVGAFKLEVIPLIDSYTVNEELSLEQYFLLHAEFNLNTLKVVNNFSGVRAKPLYMYTKDFSELIYSSCIQEDFIFKLRIHHSSISRSLKTGELYLGKYIFTDKPVVGVKEIKMSITDINTMLDKDRTELQVFNGRKVVLTRVSGAATDLPVGDGLEDSNDKKEFDSIPDTIAYLNTIAPSNKTTLYRYIESGKPYHGYICSWKGETRRLVDKSISVNITHVPTGVTEVFPSFRKAALSFASHKISTTGQTLKVFAESGKLFRGEYKITLS